MRAFVIRGFGQKAGVDFERVHAELIARALQQAGIDGGTTGDILQAAMSARTCSVSSCWPTWSWPTYRCTMPTFSTNWASGMPCVTAPPC